MLDQAAVLLSGLCLLHCLLLPLVLLAAPVLGQLTDDHFHMEMLLVVVPVSIAALSFGYPRHHEKIILFAGFAGLLLLLLGGTFFHHRYGAIADTVVTVIGSLLLAATHFFNSRMSRRCSGLQEAQ